MKKPVRNLKRNNEVASLASQATAAFVSAPDNEQIKKSFTGEYLSASERIPNTNVPATNPIMTADVTRLTAYWLNRSDCFNSGKTALPTNQSDVPANCDITIIGNTFLWCLVSLKRFVLFLKIGYD